MVPRHSMDLELKLYAKHKSMLGTQVACFPRKFYKFQIGPDGTFVLSSSQICYKHNHTPRCS